MTRIVTSPAGEKIEIVPDAEWMATTDTTPQSLRVWYSGWKPYYIRALWEHGEFTNSSGRATSLLREYIIEHYKPETDADSITHWFVSNSTVADRVTKGKRTYSIKLIALPEMWYEKLLADIKQDEFFKPTPEPEPLPAEITEWVREAAKPPEFPEVSVIDIPPMPTPLPDPELPVDAMVAQQVAMSLLTEVVNMIQSGGNDQRLLVIRSELSRTQENLAKRLEENDKLRKDLRAAGDELRATKDERNTLRTRVRNLEYNLREAMKNAGSVVNSEVNKRIEQFMRETPKGGKE